MTDEITSLERPSAQVAQRFRTQTPTFIEPTLNATVVGVARQILELQVQDSAGNFTLNTDAALNLPASFLAAAPAANNKYMGLNGLVLAVQANNKPEVQVVFSDTGGTGLTPSTVVSVINKRLLALGNTTLRAVLSDDKTQWRLETTAVGPFTKIQVTSNTDTTLATTFGIGLERCYFGISGYRQFSETVIASAYPDAVGNLSELVIENDSVRVFLGTGSGNVYEASRTTAHLDSGEVNAPAVTAEGSVDTDTAAATLDGQTLIIKVNGGESQTLTFDTPLNAAAVLSQVDAAFEGVTASLGSGNDGLVLTSVTGGASSSIEIVSGTALATLGLTASTVLGTSIETIDDGNGDVFTSLYRFEGENFTTSATAAALVGSAAATSVTDGRTLIISDGSPAQTIVFNGATTPALILAQINAVMGVATGGKITASEAAGVLTFTHAGVGEESVIKILGGTALPELDPGGTPTIVEGAVVRGVPHPPSVGDELYIQNQLVGVITDVAPGGDVDVLQLDSFVPINTAVGRYWYIRAVSLPEGFGDGSRPTPELVVADDATLTIKHELLRDLTGAVVESTGGAIYVTFNAIRQDVTALAADAGLLTLNGFTELESQLSPITAQNPLGLGIYFAMLNAPNASITGLGVDSISATQPEGTTEAYARAAEFLEGRETYAIALMTPDTTVHQIFSVHATTMSEPENRGERIAIVNPKLPTRALDTTVASGFDGDALATTIIDTKVANLPVLLQQAGIDAFGVLPVADGVFIEIESSSLKWSISEVNGSRVTLRTQSSDFASEENDDLFYAEEALALPIVSQAFSVRVRGAELLKVDNTVDNQKVAETVHRMGRSYGNRRLWMVVPDEMSADIGGIRQRLPGYYMTAVIAGMIAQYPPQQSFTNLPHLGIAETIGTKKDRFTEKQLSVMSGGGAYIIEQATPNSVPTAFRAQSTDMTQLETYTDTVIKTVDYAAKFTRRTLRTFIGRYNITASFIDTLSTVADSVSSFLVDEGVLNDMTLERVLQNAAKRDEVLLDLALDPPIPCNQIRVTLII